MKVDVSIVICTYNRCESLKITLESLLKQDADDRIYWRVLIVDNNSTDQTKNVVESFMKRFDGRLKYFLETQRGISYARNRGIKEALGEFIAFTDDDCVIDKNWVSNLYDTFKQYNADAVGGRILPIYPEQVPAWVKDNIQLLCGAIVFHDHGEGVQMYQKPMVEAVGANMSFRAEVFRTYGPFRTDLGVGRGVMGEDTEFFKRIQKGEAKLYYSGNALVWHPVDAKRMTLGYIGRWNVALGKYRAVVDEHGKLDPQWKYYFRIPRYLIRKLIHDGFWAACFFFDRNKFLPIWIRLSVNWGRAMAIREIHKNPEKSSKFL